MHRLLPGACADLVARLEDAQVRERFITTSASATCSDDLLVNNVGLLRLGLCGSGGGGVIIESPQSEKRRSPGRSSREPEQGWRRSSYEHDPQPPSTASTLFSRGSCSSRLKTRVSWCSTRARSREHRTRGRGTWGEGEDGSEGEGLWIRRVGGWVGEGCV
jgi:hypothetical protein